MAKNSFFRFKQFTVHQDKCAMKVCTDACVLGAWADVAEAESILDIGAGTGLLSLMVAQRNPFAKIDAVELDPDAFIQAGENVENSSFSERIDVFNSAIQNFDRGLPYDCIITNPPFFQSDLLSPNLQKNNAHHATSLSFDELLISIGRLLKENGRFFILLPTDEAEGFLVKSLISGWFLNTKLTLYHDKNKKPFRQLMSFGRKKITENQLIIDSLYIYDEDSRTYNSDFKALMKDFYMIF
ncbi:tRNA1(Val) (adenine(37)-N6)-methyltransferase [Dyadobacter psychrotolerans]|uniref:tRNA1(Val) (adenine(37)-N6)-methyltransferase n=1 Tax=Dyadobacter psychrotolerans TaxID=2541721 RepID=A0A4R5DXX4_9BACT|nr:methyltransferase [Dyadobacter psychrotolerans]TDE16195.1 methyltransferase domain-containing protein [Dyadobacter psychrotolerans]